MSTLKDWSPIKGKGDIMLIFDKYHGEDSGDIEIQKFETKTILTEFVNECAQKYKFFVIHACYNLGKEIEFEPAKIITQYFIKPN